jgi:hypothetical protein
MRGLLKLFPTAHLVISLMFALCALALLGIAGVELWGVVFPGGAGDVDVRVEHALEAIALLTIALAALELAQTIMEEEVQREAHMSAPTRVRRFLSRFLVVLVVALSIESLVTAFRYSHENPSDLPYAAAIAIAAAALLAAWGLFVRLNRAAEELEPEAMQEAKEEDKRVEKTGTPPGFSQSS